MTTPNLGVANLEQYLSRVDQKLAGLINPNILGIDRFLTASGKRFRPSLVIAVAFMSEKEIDDQVIRAAVSVELVHLATLIHDDIMDNGTERWGQKTINQVEGGDVAILAGDYLLAKACELAASIGADYAKLISTTIQQLCEGQAIELKDSLNLDRKTIDLEQAIAGKTSALFAASLAIGGMVSGLKGEQLTLLKEFAHNFGLAYQTLDDINDIGPDTKEGNYTLSVILALEDRAFRDRVVEKIESTKIGDGALEELLDRYGFIELAHQQAVIYTEKSLEVLDKLANRRLAAALSEFSKARLA